MDKELNSWIFNFNSYTDTWRAVKREDYQLLFNDPQDERVLKSKKIETIIEFITKQTK